MSFARARARCITKRGSPSYGSPPGLSTSQNRRPTLWSWVSLVRHGRIRKVDGSGMAIMSDSSIRLNPVIDEPSKPIPPSSAPASPSRPPANDLSAPKMSVNQNRMNSTLCSSTCARTSPAPALLSSMVATESSFEDWGGETPLALCASGDLLAFVRLEDGLALLAGTDPDRVLDGEHEQLPVADLAGPGVTQDRLLYYAQVLRFHHDLELELGPQVHCERRAPVVLGDRLLPA